jgi:ribosomal protein S18 acetylase RimI-like enzyme
MQSRYVDGVTIRLLRNGDTATVDALVARLGQRSRAQRFGGAKPRLTNQELEALARVDGEHHVLVAYVDGDARPAGIAQLVRDGSAAEVAFAVADELQGRGLGSILSRELAADARAAGIVELRATVSGDNPRAVSLLSRRSGAVTPRWCGGQWELAVSLEKPAA